jgi:hypothetical protein
VLLPGYWDWHLDDLLNNLLHNLLHWYRDFDRSDHFMRHLDSLHIRHRHVIRNLDAALNNPDNFLREMAIDDFLHGVGHVDWGGHWDVNWCWDWVWPVNNSFHNLLDRVRHIPCYNSLNRVRDLHWHFLVLGHWNLDDFLHNLFDRVWDSSVNDTLHGNWHTSLDNDFLRDWHLNDFRHSNLAGNLHHLLHNLLHWVRNIAILNLLNGDRDLNSADDFVRHGNVPSCDDFMWNWDLNTFGNDNLIWNIHTPLDHLLHRVWNLPLNHLLNGIWHLAVHDFLHRVGNLHMLWHLNWHINGYLSDNFAWYLHRDLAHHLLCHRVRLMTHNFTDHRVWNRHLLNHTPLNWDGNVNGLFNNLRHRHWDALLHNLLNRVRHLAVLDAFHRNGNLNSLRNRDLTWDRHPALDNALNGNWNSSLDNTLNRDDVFAFNQFNLMLPLHLNVLHLRNVFTANDTLASQLCPRRDGLAVRLRTRVSSGGSIACPIACCCSVSCGCCSKPGSCCSITS